MQQLNTDAFHALGDPNRRQMLTLLSGESLSINALAQNFDMSRPAVSKHVKMLQLAGFITIEDIGRERYCQLNQEGFIGVQQWINHFDSFWKQKVGRLEQLLDAETDSKNG
ncbi:ArsR/SmtB family transcription factor [Mucilaginibacter sp. AW1-3]